MSQKPNEAKDALIRAVYLEELLLRQIDRLRSYDLDAAMAYAEEAEAVAAEVTAGGVLNLPANAELKKRIETLYRELTLIIASQRQEVADKLDQIRDGIKTLSAYAGKR